MARHGNTFNAGEKVVMVGAKEDLALTEFGRQQAKAVGCVLYGAGIELTHILAGPLKRTQEFARIIVDALGVALRISSDSRLTELDYGAWSGLSEGEIVALSGVCRELL